MHGLSILVRGSIDEKLRWIFNLYDVNGDGKITKDELQSIIGSVYDLMGRFTEPAIESNTSKAHVEHIFKVFCRLDVLEDYRPVYRARRVYETVSKHPSHFILAIDDITSRGGAHHVDHYDLDVYYVYIYVHGIYT